MNEVNELQSRLDKISLTYEEIISKSIDLARIEERNKCIDAITKLMQKQDGNNEFIDTWNRAIESCVLLISIMG